MGLPIEAIIQGEVADAGNAKPAEVAIVTKLTPLAVNSTGSDEAAIAVVGLTPTLGDSVVILRLSGITVALAKLGTGTAPSPPSMPVISDSSSIPAQASFSWRDGGDFRYISDVRQGAQDSGGAWSGAWFYQGIPNAQLAGVTVTDCAVQIHRAPGGTPGPQAAHVSLSSTGIWPIADLTSPPAPVGTAVDAVLSAGESQWVTLPAAMGQALVDGSGGLMVAGDSPMVILEGIDTDPESGLIRIDWTR